MFFQGLGVLTLAAVLMIFFPRTTAVIFCWITWLYLNGSAHPVASGVLLFLAILLVVVAAIVDVLTLRLWREEIG